MPPLSRPLRIASMASLLALALPAYPVSLTYNFDLTFDAITLSGVGPVALADTWADVDTQVDVTQSALAPSTLSGTVVVDNIDNIAALSVSTSLTGNFFLDLMFTDVDGAGVGVDFGDDLGPVFSIPAIVSKPLTASVSSGPPITEAQLVFLAGYIEINGGTIDEAVIAYNATAEGIIEPIVGLIVTAPLIERALGTDANGAPVDLDNNGSPDAISYSAEGFLLTGSSIIEASIAETLFDDLIAALGSTTDVVIDFAGTIDVDVSGLLFEGGIFDLVSDPPFSLALSGNLQASPTNATALPEPAPAVLVAVSLMLLAGLRRRRRRA